jgi:hypothetical protein
MRENIAIVVFVLVDNVDSIIDIGGKYEHQENHVHSCPSSNDNVVNDSSVCR